MRARGPALTVYAAPGRLLSCLRSPGHHRRVKGIGKVGGQDRERSGSGAALTPKRRALDGTQPSTEGAEPNLSQGLAIVSRMSYTRAG